VWESTATIAASAAADDAASAETEPPPGAGDSLEKLAQRQRGQAGRGRVEAELDHTLLRIERFHFRETERADRGLHERRLWHAGWASHLRQRMPACIEQHGQRYESDDL
jgi:hypothetical protein